jgi:hypothetical protein
VVFFPLDRQLKLKTQHWSEGLLKLMVWLSGIVDYRTAEQVLRTVGQTTVSDSSVWRQAQEWGQCFQELAEAEQVRGTAVPGRWGKPSRETTLKGRMGVALDGSMMHILEEGWKEVKIGCVFDVEVQPTRDQETGDWEDLAHAVNNSYVAHLGGPEVLGQMAWAEASRRGWERAADTQVLGDGAPWIWNLAVEHFYDSQQTVDWVHAMQHLAAAGHLLKGEGTLAHTRWFNNRKTVLFGGHAERIAHELAKAAPDHPAHADTLRKEANYFHKHKRRMNYQEMREDGWLIGSGMVESAAKQFKARFAGPGMRWSRPGAERLLPVRAAIMSHRFDELWPKAYNSPPA